MAGPYYQVSPDGTQRWGLDVDVENLKQGGLLLGSLLRWWAQRFNVEQNKKGNTGVVLAIRKARQPEYKTLWNNLIRDLDNDLRNSQSSAPFQLIDLPDVLADWVDGTANRQKADRYLERTKSHIILYGGFFKVDDQIVFSIRSTVLHLHIPGRSVADDIRPLLLEVRFDASDKTKAFEVMRKWLTCVIKYITYRGALLSQDPFIAETIFRELINRDLNHVDESSEPFSLLRPIIFEPPIQRLKSKMAQTPGAMPMWAELPFHIKKGRVINLQY